MNSQEYEGFMLIDVDSLYLKIKQFQDSQDLIILNESCIQKMAQNDQWIDCLGDLEIELKAILYDRVINISNLPQYLSQRLQPFIIYIMNKIIFDHKRLKLQCYLNEILHLIQKLIFKIWKLYPTQLLEFLKLIHQNQMIEFYNSRISVLEDYKSTINKFYYERQKYGIINQAESYLNQQEVEIFYPLQNEVLDQHHLVKNVHIFSPFQRMQINYFYKNGGFELLNESFTNFTLKQIEVLYIQGYLKIYIDKQLYMSYFQHLNYQQIAFKLTDEDIKNASKENIEQFNSYIPNLIDFKSTYQERQKEIEQIQMSIYLQCFRCSSLQKRIFGLQQLCKKINTNHSIIQNYQNNQTLLKFLIENQVFQDLFGEKTHLELIKGSFPLIKFLYQNKSIKGEELISILRLARGRHETWINIISTILQDLAEILNLEDIQIMLQNIQSNQIGLDSLKFIKSLGKNKYLNNYSEDQDQNIIDNRYKKQKLNADDDCKVISYGNFSDQKQDRNHVSQIIQPQQTMRHKEEQIKTQIVEYLLNLVHDQPNNIIGQTAFEIAIELICHQFQFLRIQYLNIAIEALNSNQDQLSFYFNMIQQIIQSSYPIEQFKKSDEILIWMEERFNLKLNHLRLMQRQKLKFLLKEESVYLKVIIQCVNFYKFLHKNSKINQYELQILWRLLVENARYLEERDLFFDWFNEQLNLENDAMEWLFIKIIKQNHLSESMLKCLINLILYFNVKYKVIKLLYDDEYQLFDYNLIGLNILWKIFHSQPELYNQLYDFLIKLLKMNQKPNILNSLKQQYLNELFSCIQNPTSIQFVIQLLEEFEGFKIIEQEEKISITILNNCQNALNPKKQDIQLQCNLQVYQAKQIIGQKLNPQMRPEEFDILCRGSLFKDQNTLKDYKVNQNLTFTISNKYDFNQEDDTIQQENQDINEKINKIQDIVNIQNKQFILSVLKDKNFNVDTTIGDLIDQGDQLYMQYQQKNVSKALPKKIETSTSFASLISNQYIDQLFNLLNYNNQQRNAKIWSILQMIPRNPKVYQLIEQSQNDWSKLLIVDNKYRLQYHLQILKEQLLFDFVEDQDVYKILRYNFLSNGGLQLLLNNLDNPIEIVLIILEILQMYLNSHAINELRDYNYLMLLKLKSVDQIISLFSTQTQIQDNQFQQSKQFQVFYFCEKHDVQINWENLLNSLFHWIGIEQCYTIILCLLYVKPNLLNYPLPINQLLHLLNNSKLEQRRMAAIFILTLNDICIKNRQNFSIKFLPILIQGQTEYEELFIVIAELIDQTQDISFLQTKELVLQILDFIKNRQINESPFIENEDKVLQGNLLLLKSLLKKDDQLSFNLIEIDFSKYIYECLFEMKNNYSIYPVYKRNNTRKRAFDLLLELSKVQNHLNQILQLIQINQHKRPNLEESNFDYGIKGSHGYVGLQNLGATCYINSLLQQLFMNIHFRKCILDVQILKQNNLKIRIIKINNANTNQHINLNENTLYQLQLVFIQLQESVKQYINPNQFIKTLKGFDGQQINPLIQEDCNEFFNLLTGKLELDLKPTLQSNLINQSFGGTLVNEIKSLESDCDFKKETEEPFLTVSVEIKNKKSLYEALDLFVKSDVLDGENQYFCDEVQRKIDAEKRCYFIKLPKTFIFHLKRFEFDINTNTRSKINDYCEFPLEINMFQWTRDNIVEHKQLNDFTEYKYVLKGVLVHTGSAEGGHYFSYIKDHKDEWFEFNDKLITHFDVQNLREKCFGGNQNNEWGIQNSKNAYMLFYEKQCVMKENKQNHIEIEIEDVSENKQILREQIIKENTKYIENKLFNAQEYVNFVKTLVQSGMKNYQFETSLELLQLFTTFTFSQFLKNKDIFQFKNNLKVLNNFYNQNNQACVWLLEYWRCNKQILIECLIEYELIESVQLINLVIDQAYLLDIFILQKFFQFYLSELLPILRNNNKNRICYYRVISYYLERTDVLFNQIYQDGYFYIFYEILKERIQQIQTNNYFKIILQNEDFLIIICEIISKIIRCCETFGMSSNKICPTYIQIGSLNYKVDQLWIEELFQQNQFRKYILSMVQHQNQLIFMIKHICWYDQNISQKVIQEIVIQIQDNQNQWQQLEKISEILIEILKIEDGLQEKRINWIFSYENPFMETSKRGTTILNTIQKDDLDYVIGIICMLAEIGSKVISFSQYLNTNKRDFEYLLYKLKDILKQQFNHFQYPIQKMQTAIKQFQNIFELQFDINMDDDNRRQSEEESLGQSNQAHQDQEDTNQNF
ncbi:unnamed protein product [Paramecium pentaurelia]|uniref:USP domain-containing protein n=1 Tax=Paramecium pentaurelia TaxID=43138 RepID=A0A8S1WIG2_9CILI|nr:unnamed protein product [Paramecium pentaurelia]